ncbi:TnsA endonuclease C-terminal domain-containing protein [Jeotgalibacillus sp. JSM ZJ347]|uniref:TnsA endonuclease C-terminal domain-containing protein n=1 Tax=Jeotgalibacillus sp. JSM ZJ347 TaxID=3342117 RepID=UPI0035A8BFA0
MYREWTESTLKRFLKEGRGTGRGTDYKPWLQVQDISSQGRSTRVFSHKLQRVVHLMSDLQLNYFNCLEFDSHILEFKEQFPLLDFHELDLGLDKDLQKRIFDKETHVPHMQIVTFLITRLNEKGEEFQQARAIKLSSELDKKATIDRLEIQRRYFEQKGIDFGVVTEKEINKELSRNIGWVMTAFDIRDYPDLNKNISAIKSDLESHLYNYPAEKLQKVLQRIESAYHLDDGTGLVLFKHLIATKQISVNMARKLDPSNNVEWFEIEINNDDVRRDDYAVGG